jgi:ATP-binding cassette, subfamily B, bacterial PglK
MSPNMIFLKNFLSLLNAQDKKFLLALFLFSLIVAMVETVGIAAIKPLIDLLADSTILEKEGLLRSLYLFSGEKNISGFILIFGISLIGFYFLRAVMNIIYMYFLNYFTFSRYRSIAYRLFEKYMSFSYQQFIALHSSHLNKSIITEAMNVTHVIKYLLFIFSELMIVIFLYSWLLYENWQITLVMTIVMGGMGVLLTKVITPRVKAAGVKRSASQGNYFKIINEAFANFKMIKIKGTHELFYKDFLSESKVYADTNTLSGALTTVPRNVLEFLGFSMLIVVVLIVVSTYEDSSFALPLITMYALALYRILPSMNRILSSINGIAFNAKAFDIVLKDLNEISEVEGKEGISFNKSIEVRNLNFSYEENKVVLQKIAFSIKKSEKVAFVGESGSGKSTLIDLIMGVLNPNDGNILIDSIAIDRENIASWRKRIGYIPQKIYLFDGTIAQNVVFGSVYDENRVIEVLQQARIYDYLKTKEGLNTIVGEGGVKLSGGQVQRIAIARALYSDPEVLVLDEATSALDSQTEEAIMNEIYEVAKDKTLLIIAHRLSTIERCERVIRLEKGVIVE